MSPPDLITAYLLARLAGTTPLLVIVAAIACPMVWSRDVTRRARAQDALRLLARILSSRRTR